MGIQIPLMPLAENTVQNIFAPPRGVDQLAPGAALNAAPANCRAKFRYEVDLSALGCVFADEEIMLQRRGVRQIRVALLTRIERSL